LLNKFIDEKLDKISNTGMFFGHHLGKVSRAVLKGVFIVGTLLLFGSFIFLWAMAQGTFKKSKDEFNVP